MPLMLLTLVSLMPTAMEKSHRKNCKMDKIAECSKGEEKVWVWEEGQDKPLPPSNQHTFFLERMGKLISRSAGVPEALPRSLSLSR